MQKPRNSKNFYILTKNLKNSRFTKNKECNSKNVKETK